MTSAAASKLHLTIVRRVAYAAATVALVAAIAHELAQPGTAGWQVAVFAIAPDLGLLAGAAPGLARGQMHPRGVTAYNALHRLWGPAALVAAAGIGVLPPAFLAGGLAWAAHVTFDRAVGYGLRNRDGFQRR
jgi:hypothetical protein